MLFNSLMAFSVAIGSRGLAKAACVELDDWINGPSCITGNGGDITSEIVDDLVKCMQDDVGDSANVAGNGVIPPFGSGTMINWYKDDVELYMINSNMDDVCVDAGDAGDLIKDGFEEGCININWDNDGDWLVKIGVARCDVVYGCDGSAVDTSVEC